MSEEGARRARERRGFVVKHRRREEIGERRLQRVEQQRQSRQILPARAQHVGRADIARANGAQISGARQPGQDQPEGHGAEHIADPQREQRVKAV